MIRALHKCNLYISFFFLLFLGIGYNSLEASCNLKDTTSPQIIKHKVVPATCPNNGKIFIKVRTNSGGGRFVYEIVKGPMIRIIQSQDSFLSLEPGNYTIRVTGCNGKFSDITLVIKDEYFFPDEIFAYQIDRNSSFRCGKNSDAKIWFYFYPGLRQCYGQQFSDSFKLSDTQFIRYPLRYQVSTSTNPYTGFNGITYDTMKPTKNVVNSGGYCSNTMLMYSADTIKNLAQGGYSIRVTDACQNYTTSRRINVVDYSSGVRQIDLRFATDYTVRCSPRIMVRFYDRATGSELPRYTSFTQYDNGPLFLTFIDLSTNDTVYNKLNIYSSRTPYYLGSYYNQNYSFKPNTDYLIKYEDACGDTVTYTHRTGSTALRINHFVNCNYINDQRYFTFNTRSGEYWTKDLQNGNIFNVGENSWASTGVLLDSFEIGKRYTFYLKDTMCGGFDSITFTHGSVTANNPAPEFSVDTFGYKKCSPNQQNTFVKLTCTNCNQPGMQNVYIDSGAYIDTTRKMYMYRHYPAYVYSNQTLYGYYQTPFKAGTQYRTISVYSCGKLDTFRFTVPIIRDTNYTYQADFWLDTNLCNASSEIKLTESMTSTNVNAINGSIVFESGPQEALDYYINQFKDDSIRLVNYTWDTITIVSGNSADIKYPLVFKDKRVGDSRYKGYLTLMEAHYKSSNYTYPVRRAPKFNDLPKGTYKYSIVDDCGNVLLRDSIIINSGLVGQLRMGATIAYICPTDTANKFIYANPTGGRKSYQYRIRHQDSAWRPLQSNPRFALAPNTTEGERFYVQVQDSCGKSYTGEVSTATFSGDFYLYPDTVACIGKSIGLRTAYVPGATYSWHGPKGTITSNVNSVKLNNIQPSDTGEYRVIVNCLDSCIYDTASHTIVLDNNCPSLLSVDLLNFKGVAISITSNMLKWKTASEYNSKGFYLLKSIDKENWKQVGFIQSKSLDGNSNDVIDYSFVDDDVDAEKSITYYKLVPLDQNGSKARYKECYVVRNANEMIVSANPNLLRNEDRIINLDVFAMSKGLLKVDLYYANGTYLETAYFPISKNENVLQYWTKNPLQAGQYLLVLSTEGKSSKSIKITKI